MAQYQHYIPQLLLKNFSHPYRGETDGELHERGAIKREKGKYKGNPVLHLVDLASDSAQLLEAPISRCFGFNEMYDDMTKMIESRNDIEKKLSSLESQAAAILGKVMKALSDKQPDVILLRKEVNVLRKFLFVMKYRGPQYYAKYFTGGTQSYNHIDKHLVEGFMLKKSISSPRKVWLHNLLTILDLKMDVKGEWMTAILESMFPADAHMFIYHMRTYYMAFCVPATVDDEFVLTAGAYNVMEGPTNEARDGDTGEYRPQSFISWHEFGVVAPGLLIVLRNNLLPAPLEDANEVVKKLRQSLREAAIQMMPGIGDKESILEDLPAAKALCSTNIVVDGVLQLSPGKDGEMQPKNEFCFKFWPIQTKHLDIINAIFLDNIKDLAGIVFSSKYSFQRTLEAYMLDETNNFKQIYLDEPEGNKSRATCLRKLEEVLTLLGSSITPVYHNAPGRSESVLSCLDKIWIQMMAKLCDNTGTADAKSAHAAFWNTYRSLGKLIK